MRSNAEPFALADHANHFHKGGEIQVWVSVLRLGLGWQWHAESRDVVSGSAPDSVQFGGAGAEERYRMESRARAIGADDGHPNDLAERDRAC